jgi:hypothetical protein
MLRTILIKKYVNTSDIQWIIGHSPVVHLKEAIIMLSLLFLFYVAYAVIKNLLPDLYSSIPTHYWDRGMGIIGIFLFIKRVLDFLNLYLDCLILSKDHAILFLREGRLEYKTEFFSRNKINTISSSQNGIRNKIWSVGDIVIKLEFDTEFPFADVTNPKKQVSKLITLKEQFMERQKQVIEKDLHEDDQRFNVLVEAMSEVVKDYLDKSQYK